MTERDLLTDFVIDNPELERLEDIISDFNLFEVLNLQKQEIRHSNFLAWVLNPTQPHALGSYLLKRVLIKASSRGGSIGDNPISPIDVDVWDLSETLVLREENRIDILLLNEVEGFVCAIENKLDSQDHSQQLSRYRNLIEKKYPDFKRQYILLSPEGDPPKEEGEIDYWVTMGYGEICEALEKAIEIRSHTMSGEVRSFIQHYTTMLRRHVLEDSEVQTLARKIYQRHQKAIELINEYKPDYILQIKEILEELVQAEKTLSLDHSSKSFIRFYSGEWDNYKSLLSGRGQWTPSNRVLLFEAKNPGDSLRLSLLIGPGERSMREKIFEMSRQNPAFNPRSRELGQKWNTIFQKEILKKADLREPDLSLIEPKIRDAMASFFSEDLEKINLAIKGLFTETPGTIAIR